MRRTAIPDCDHGRDHVVCVGEQSALSHDGKCAATSTDSPQFRVLRNAARIPASARNTSKPALKALASMDWKSCLHAPGSRSQTSRPSACVCRILRRTHSPFPSIAEMAGGRICVRSSLWIRATGEIVRWEAFSGYNSGRQLRAWARFTHTGEAGGWLGQTIAVIASAGASLLVFTGLSLGVRRLFAWKGRRVKVILTTRWSASANPVFSLSSLFSVVRLLFSLRLPPLLQCLAL